MVEVEKPVRRRFQYSLSGYLLLVGIVGVFLGIWQGMLVPIKDEWNLVRPYLKSGGIVETIPNGLPPFLGVFLDEGESGRIESITFRGTSPSAKELRSFSALPF